MAFEMGEKVTLENYTQAAIACNKAGDRHIEEQDGQYVIVANPAQIEPTVEQKVQALEAETGLTRALRELVLSENSGSSDYVKQKAQEIEQMAQVLRISDDQEEIQEALNAETIVNLMVK